ELIVNQVKGKNSAKNELLKNYKNPVWDIIEDSKAFSINSIPRKKNEATKRLIAIGAAFDVV
ncbi:hypothetical protein KI387_003044, partial [Taxus chinensis]